MTRKLHIGNLPLDITDDELSQKFMVFGTVASAVILKNGSSGKSQGLGIVEMEDNAAASAAIKWMHLSSYDGNVMSVSSADIAQRRE